MDSAKKKMNKYLKMRARMYVAMGIIFKKITEYEEVVSSRP
jgi:hypothetical protein